MLKKLYGAIAALPFLLSTAFAALLPINSLTIPETSGINIHFTTGHEHELDMIKQAGFKWVRMDFVWSSTERTKGQYDWRAYEGLTRQLRDREMAALYILDYSNPLYETEVVSKDPITKQLRRTIASPRNPESIAAFAKWAASAVSHFSSQPIVWEVWNEPNIHFWAPEPNAEEYLRLLQATLKAIRQSNPTAQVIAPASSGFPWVFLTQLFKGGILRELDAVSVHPYRSYDLPPETVISDYMRLKGLIDAYTPASRDPIPIVSGEWGYATTRNGGLTLEQQAAYLIRQQLVNLWAGIPLSIWYDWKDDGTDPDNWEHNFGIVTFDLRPKPSYYAFKKLSALMKGYGAFRRIAYADPNAWLLLCHPIALVDQEKPVVMVAWYTAGKRSISLPIKKQEADGIQLLDIMGNPRLLQWNTNDMLQLDLDGTPQYLLLPPSTEFAKAHLSWRLVNARPTALRTGKLALNLVCKNIWKEAIVAERIFQLQNDGETKSVSQFTTELLPNSKKEDALSLSYEGQTMHSLTVTVRWKRPSGELILEAAEWLPLPIPQK